MKQVLCARRISIFLISTTHVLASAAPRLIQISPTERVWMGEEGIAELTHKSHDEGKCPGFMDVTNEAKDLRDQTFVQGQAPRAAVVFPKNPTFHRSIVDPMLGAVSEGSLMGRVQHLSNYKDRYCKSQTGITASNWIAGQFREFAKGRTDVKVELIRHQGFQQPSVRARIQGVGPQKDEVVVLGGHLDSINRGFLGIIRESALAPGADDNASGISTVMEAFKAFMSTNYRPNRTIEFYGYAGEEIGLKGSQEIADDYARRRVKVATVMQLDMTMFPGAGQKITFISDYTDSNHTDFAIKVSDEYIGIETRKQPCGYACSDHASWNKRGFPAIFPNEAGDDMNKALHTTRDRTNLLDGAFGLKFAKLAVAYAVEAAEADSI